MDYLRVTLLCIVFSTLAIAQNSTLSKINTFEGVAAQFSVFSVEPFRGNLSNNYITIPANVLARQGGGVLRHTFGTKQQGDKLLASGAGDLSSTTLRNIQLKLKFPEKGTSPIKITYLEVSVQQDTAEGRAYVLQGAVGTKFIEVAVEGYNTRKFVYTANIYGSASRAKPFAMVGIVVFIVFAWNKVLKN